MSGHISKLLKTLNPAQVSNYLIGSGWVRADSYRGIAGVWVKEDYELLVPEDRGLSDFIPSMVDLLHKLERFEHVDISSIVNRIIHSEFDVIQLGIQGREADYGSIPLGASEAAFSGIRQSLLFAAWSLLDAKREFKGRRPKIIEKYVSNVRVGQTEYGSYVINVISPLSIPSQKLETTDALGEHVGRATIQAFSNSLSSFQRAKEAFSGSSLDSEWLGIAIESGLSSNFCAAVSEFSSSIGRHKESALRLNINLSPSFTDSSEIKTSFEFDRETVHIASEISEALKEEPQLRKQRIIGLVDYLKRIPDQEKGEIKILAIVEDRPAHVKVSLEGEDYEKAILAHKNRDGVVVWGNLEIGERVSELHEPQDFRVIESNLFDED